MFETLSNALLVRRLVQNLAIVGDQLKVQNGLLQRLVDKIAPEETPPTPVELRDTAVSFSRDALQADILTYSDKFFRSSGREPTDEEIAAYLDSDRLE